MDKALHRREAIKATYRMMDRWRRGILPKRTLAQEIDIAKSLILLTPRNLRGVRRTKNKRKDTSQLAVSVASRRLPPFPQEGCVCLQCTKEREKRQRCFTS